MGISGLITITNNYLFVVADADTDMITNNITIVLKKNKKRIIKANVLD